MLFIFRSPKKFILEILRAGVRTGDFDSTLNTDIAADAVLALIRGLNLGYSHSLCGAERPGPTRQVACRSTGGLAAPPCLITSRFPPLGVYALFRNATDVVWLSTHPLLSAPTEKTASHMVRVLLAFCTAKPISDALMTGSVQRSVSLSGSSSHLLIC